MLWRRYATHRCKLGWSWGASNGYGWHGYRSRPEVKEHERAWRAAYMAKPEVKERHREWGEAYRVNLEIEELLACWSSLHKGERNIVG